LVYVAPDFSLWAENQGQRVLEELIKDMRVQVLEPIAARLDKSAELTQQASEAVLTLHKELGGISQSLASSILTIQNFQKETLVELKVFANYLGYTLSQFQTDTKGVLEQTAQEINRAVDQSIQGMTAQRSAFETSAVQAAATFRGIREELQTALQERAIVEQQMLQATQTGIIQILTQANRTFNEQTNTLYWRSDVWLTNVFCFAIYHCATPACTKRCTKTGSNW